MLVETLHPLFVDCEYSQCIWVNILRKNVLKLQRKFNWERPNFASPDTQDMQRTNGCFQPIDKEVISSYPLSRFGDEDKLIWHYEKMGCMMQAST